MIQNTISYLVKKGKQVIYDAEHFFDGYKENPDYAIKTSAALESKADKVVLCDTNGGTLYFEINKILKELKSSIGELCLGFIHIMIQAWLFRMQLKPKWEPGTRDN